MLCVRCSHPLPPRADRCLRCFALNPQNRAGALSRPFHDSGPAAPVALAFASDPPARPLELSFEDEPLGDVPLGDLEADLADADPGPAPRFASEPPRAVARAPEPVPAPPAAVRPAPERAPRRASAAARLLAWALDGALLCAATCAHLLLASRLEGDSRHPLDVFFSAAPLWAALAAFLAVAYSWFFVALGGRTPGMALTGQRLCTLQGDAPTPAEALLRALVSLPSAALGLFGFVLALFDARGQTLHDKLCRCVVVVD
jgi:uncharacterized RDD family membrane protein YckC